MEFSMRCELFPHSCASWKCSLYKLSLVCSFFLYINLISSGIRNLDNLVCVNMPAGDIIGILIFT